MIWNSRKQKRLEMIQAIRPTSKAALKLQCLWVNRGNVEEADKLYEYFAKDLPDLPDYDPVQPTWQESTKDTVNGLMSWIKDNKETLAEGIEFARGIFGKAPVLPAAEPTPLPPINDDV